MMVRPSPGRPPLLIEAVEARLLFSTFIVKSTADSGPDSLRQAIIDANANDAPTAPVDDEIVFNILPEGPHTIKLLSQLPEIMGNVTIDATTQPGYESNHTPVIELNGQGAGVGADGLRIASRGPVAASNVLGLIINGFSGNGVVFSGDFNALAQCYIGTDPSGGAAGPGNGGHGVLITGNHNLLAENIIAFNGADGTAVATGATGNSIAPNLFFSNGGMAIDLGDDGPTPNDAGDVDDGANRLQNYPVITSVTAATAPATGLNVTGTVNTTPNTLVEVVLYASPTHDGEGATLLEGLQPFQTDASGDGTFSANLPTASVTDWITATLTSYAFSAETSETNTSEFSPPMTAAPRAVVSEVFVRGSSWRGRDDDAGTTNFMEYLQARGLGDDVMGYRLFGPGRTVPAGNPEDVIPWINADQFVVRYATAPTGAGVPTAGTLTVRGLDQDASPYTVTGVQQVPGDPTAYVLTLSKPLGGGNPATGLAPTLRENGDSITLGVAGGGAAGGDFAITLRVLQGDTDHANQTTHAVLAADFSEVKKRFFKTTRTAETGTGSDYTPFHDINGDGSILASDFSEVKKRFFHNLPTTTVAAARSTSTPSVTRDLFGATMID